MLPEGTPYGSVFNTNDRRLHLGGMAWKGPAAVAVKLRRIIVSRGTER